MSVKLTTIGARVKYAFEATAGVRPTSGYITIPGVNEAPEVTMSPETIDVSDISSEVTEYVDGRQDSGGEKQFTLAHSDDAIAVWNTLVAQAAVQKSSNKRLWFEYRYKNASNSFFWCGTPLKLGNSGMAGNSASTLPAAAVFNDGGEWLAHSTEITPSKTSETVTAGSTKTITISNAVGDVSVKSSNPSAATVTISSNTITITGVAAGTAVIEAKDENLDTCNIVVTVTSGV